MAFCALADISWGRRVFNLRLGFHMKNTPKRLWVVLALLSFAGILRATLPQTTVGTWTSASNLGQARANAAAVMLSDGRILITGGDAGSGALQSAEIFGTNGSATAAGAMNVARSGHFAVVLSDGRVLVGGGNSSGGGATNSAEIYDPSSDAWTQTSPMTQARAGATGALLQDGRVLIAGGDNSGTPSNTIEIFDPSSGDFSFAGTLSSPRTKHAMAVLQDGRVLIVGGSDGTNPLASSDIFDPASGDISAGPSLAVARSGHSATTLLNGRVVVIGGAGNNGADLASAEIYDPASGGFSNAGAALATAREGHQAFLLPNNNSVLIVGGTSGATTVAASELFIPQISSAGVWSSSFSASGANVTARSAAVGSTMKHDGLLFAAGGNDASGNALASTELYAFPTVKTDQADYAPGSIVTVTGSGWQPGENVTLTLVESPLIDTHPQMTAVADANGNIVNTQFSPDVYDVNVRFYLTAVGSQSGLVALNTFTDNLNFGKITNIGPQTPNPVTAGSQATYSVTVNITGNNGACTSTLSVVSGLPSGAAASFSNNPFTANNTAQDQISTLTVTTSASTPAGTSTLTIRAVGSNGCSGTDTSGQQENAASPTLVVAAAAVPTVTQVNPNQGSTAGGTSVTITGTNFTGATAVKFGANAATTFSVPNSTTITATSPAGSAGSVDVTVTTVGGTSATSAADQFTYQGATTTAINAPTITYGANGSVTVTVSSGSGTPTGNVSLSVDGGTAATKALNSGSATFTNTDITALATPNAGNHTLDASYAAQGNYDASAATGTLTVNPAPLTVTANNRMKTYGQTVTFAGTEFSTSGLVNGDTVASVTLTSAGAAATATVAAPGPTYPITPSAAEGTGLGNYTVSYVDGMLTVNPAPLTITAKDRMKTYGQAVTFAGTEFTATGLVNADSVTSVTLTSAGAAATATVAAPGPTYPIVPSAAVGTGLGNYTISYVDGALTVNPAPLAITADNKTKAFGQALPMFTVTYVTLVAGDTPASLGGTLSCSTTATVLSPVGNYPITCSGQTSTNYTITYQPGTLFITQATTATSVTSSPNPSILNAPVTFTAIVTPQFAGVPTGTVTFKDGSTTIGSGVLDAAGHTTFTTSTLTVNTHTINAVYGGDSNFVGSSESTTQTVQYVFIGFLPPIDNLPVVNSARAGQTIPIKWQLKDANGNLVSDLGSLAANGLVSGSIACGSTDLVSPVEELSSPDATVFRFDGTQFIYNWQTLKSYTSCRLLQVRLADGTTHYAMFQFK